MDTSMGTACFREEEHSGSVLSPKNATLIIWDADHLVEASLQGRPEYSIGRSPSPTGQNASILLNSQLVKRGVQGVFKLRQNEWYYADAPDAPNHTLLNGAPLKPGPTGNTRLSHGDVLRIDTLSRPHEQGVWILFSTYSIQGTWSDFNLAGHTTVTIGRDASCDIRENLPYISAKHAVIQKKGEAYFLSDNRSKAGVYLNGEKVTAPTELNEKDWFCVCDCHFIFINGRLIHNVRKPGVKSKTAGEVLLTANIQSKAVPDRHAPGGTKELLKDVRLEIREGTLVAILGVSGAGKSTLMNCLNGFDSDITGSVTYRGQNLRDNFDRLKLAMGSVPQKNTFRDMQTVETELRYDAMLRLPSDFAPEDICQQVDETIRRLGLDPQRKTPLHKLSGGEQKRVSIGVELVADRELLCLDEPDAGLDPLTKRELFQTLRRLAHEEDKTIIVIIHDVAEISLFDQVIMLLKEEYAPKGASKPMYRGRLAFSGSPKDALDYFERQSRSDTAGLRPSNMTDVYELVRNNPSHYIWRRAPQSSGPPPATKGPKRHEKSLSLPKEFLMSVRQFAGILLADRQNLLLALAFPLAAALMTVLIAGENLFKTYEGTKSACFLLVSAAIWVGVFNSIQTVVRERDVIKLEYVAGRRMGCYVLSKAFVQVLLCFVQSAFLLLAFPGIVQLFENAMPEKGALDGSPLWEYYVSIFLLMFASDTMGIFISCLVKKVETANTLAPYILICQLVFSGILFPLKGIGEALSNLMLSKWGMEALGSISDVDHWPFKLELQQDGLALPHDADKMFERTSGHLTSVWFVLILFSVAFLVAGILFLRRVAKDNAR